MNAWLKSASLLPLFGLTWITYWWTGDVLIIGNVHPPIALMEQDVILSCQIGGCSPSNLEVWLYKWGDSKKNALYNHSGPKQGKIQEGSTGDRPENATHKGQFHNGVLEVTLFRVEAADSGQYVCAMTCGRVHKQVTMDVKVTGVINVTVGEGVILPCYLRETRDLSHWKLQWKRIGPGKNQTIYSCLYLYQDTCPLPYSEDSLHNKCSNSSGPNITERLVDRYEYKAEVSIRNWKGSLKLNNIKKDDAGSYQCSVRSSSFNKTIIFKLSTIEIHDRNMEMLKCYYRVRLYCLAFFVLVCCAAYFVGHKKHSSEVEVQKEEEEEERKQRNKVEEQKNGDEEERQPRIHVEEQRNSGDELQEHDIQVEEEKNDAEERQKIGRQNEEQKNDDKKERKNGSSVEQLKDALEQLKKNDEQLKDKDREVKEKDEIIEFLEARFYRVVVILNRSTAHPRLEVSKEGKCVRDTGSVLKVPKSEERFDSHMFVLAKEGFSKGRHYWEVEVGQKKNWDLGVASESISRQGKITLAPQNGYWVIGLDGKKDYWARTDPWTRLQVSGKLTKIGMFLNIPDKSLSFYDVNRRSKLHTFTLSSSEKRHYPFFSVGSVTAELDSHPLEIPPWPHEDDTE